MLRSSFLLIYAIALMPCALLWAQDPPSIGGTFVMDANGNMISYQNEAQEAAQDGLWQSGGGSYEHGIYNATPPPASALQPSQGTAPFRQNQQHSPGGKNSYFSSWGNNEITSGGGSDFGVRTETKTPSDYRDGMFQKITGSGLWSPKSGSGNKSLGLLQFELNAMFAFPMFTKESPLLVTPGFSTWLFEQGENRRADSLDLYSAKCEFRWIRPLFSQYAAILGATPGYHSAFKHGGDGFRIPLLAGGMWNYNPRTKLILGCMYLDRIDYNWLPFGGIIWTPDELEIQFELLFPNPKIAKRVRWWGSAVGNDVSDWLYVAGEFAGDCWSLKDDAGHTGSLAYRDWRFMVGYERKTTGCLRFAVEVGGLFARNYRDSIRNEDHSIDPGLFLRVKAIY